MKQSGKPRDVFEISGLQISLLGKDIIPHQSVKDVGVIFEPTLSFDNHISTVASSCMSKLSQISRIRFVFDKKNCLK